MNHSMYCADRATHLKIVVVALVAGIAVAGLGLYFDTASIGLLSKSAGPMVSSDVLATRQMPLSGGLRAVLIRL
jgi:hypothetical protein